MPPVPSNPRRAPGSLLRLAVLLPGIAGGCATTPLPPAAVVLNDQGAALLARGDLDPAEARFRLALEYQPGFAEARANLGITALARGRLVEATRELEGALELNPDLAIAWNALGVVRDRRGDPGGARDAYVRALGIDPGDLDARRNLARALLAARRPRQARAHLLRLRALDPDDPVTLRLLTLAEHRLAAVGAGARAPPTP